MRLRRHLIWDAVFLDVTATYDTNWLLVLLANCPVYPSLHPPKTLCNALCLSLCLSVSSFMCKLPNESSRKFYHRHICAQGRNDSGSGSRNFLKDSSTLQYRAFLHNLAHISGQSDWTLMKILSQMFPWTRKSLLNFGSNLDPDSWTEVSIQIQTPDPDHSPWQMCAVSDCSCSLCCRLAPGNRLYGNEAHLSWPTGVYWCWWPSTFTPFISVSSMVIHDTCQHNCTVEWRLVIGFCGQPTILICYQP